ncbi:MAG: hypothetical protein H6868_09740 [Rhodospirillales bacterium]|nr:hypothetical protein [Rhodospirillales bacterium]
MAQASEKNETAKRRAEQRAEKRAAALRDNLRRRKDVKSEQKDGNQTTCK